MCENDEVQANIEMAKFYVDYLEYLKWSRLLVDNCSDNKMTRFTFECCDAHRHLKKTGNELRERGSELCPQKEGSYARVLSPAWWKENGFHHFLYGEEIK